MDEGPKGLRKEFIEEAEAAFECTIDQYEDGGTTMRMMDSDHGYAEWIIFPLTIQAGNEKAILTVEDAGETQRRYVLTVLDDEPFMLVHSFFKPGSTATYEVSVHGKVHKR